MARIFMVRIIMVRIIMVRIILREFKKKILELKKSTPTYKARSSLINKAKEIK